MLFGLRADLPLPGVLVADFFGAEEDAPESGTGAFADSGAGFLPRPLDFPGTVKANEYSSFLTENRSVQIRN